MLYKKDADDWWCSIGTEKFDADKWKDQLGTKDAASNKKESNIQNNKLYLFYSDYLYLFLLMGFNAPTTAEAMCLRMADLVQANMRKATGNDVYLLSEATVYFKLETDVKVAPLMIAFPTADKHTPIGIESWAYWTFHEKTVRGYQ
jgi:hypothetical protein